MASTAPVMEMDAVGGRSLSAAAEDAGMPIISRAQSLPVVARESHRSTTSPTRATFPFKPASALKDISKAACNPLPASFRPVVPALSLQPRRCASFPVDIDTPGNCKTPPRQPPEPPEWLVEYVRRSLSPFPIPIDSSKDRDCWWLREMATATKVQVEDDGIELVESGEGEDVMEEGLMKSSISSGGPDVLVEGPMQSIGTKEFIATLDAAAEITSSSPNTSNKQLPQDRRQQLQAKMAELKAEMESAKDMNPEKRHEMDSLFEKVKGAIQTDGGVKRAGATSNSDDPPNHIDHIRRTTVAITGGTLTAAGVVLIPFPIIPGALVMYGGLLVLATEFEGARAALDIVRDPIEKWLADDEHEDANASKDHNPRRWDELMGCTACGSQRKHELDEDFTTLMSQRPSLETKDSDGAEKMKSPLKPFLRKLLMFDSQSETGKSDSNVGDSVGADGSMPANKTSEHNAAPVSSSCHGDLSGCRLLSFDFDGEEDNTPYRPDRKSEIMNRLCSDGSITLNTLNNDFDDETIRLFSRQNLSTALTATTMIVGE